MKFNLAVKTEKSKAMSYFMTLANKKALVEVKKISPARTLPQNSYLHLLIGAYAIATGNTLEDAKAIYKWLNKTTYYRKKKVSDILLLHVRSSVKLNKEEMAKTIDQFREKSAEQGYPLPLATDQEWLRQISNEIEGARYYL